MGVAKINVNTDLQGKNYDPRKFLKPGFDAIVERAKELVVTFGSDGKGWA